MKRLQAVNNVLIIKKDRSYLKDDPMLVSEMNYKSQTMTEIPEPYTGTVDSVGIAECGYRVGQRVAFCDMGGIYIEIGEDEFVVISPEMVICELDNE